jgi:hypothetical protein
MEPVVIDTFAQLPIVMAIFVVGGFLFRQFDIRDKIWREFLANERQQAATMAAQSLEANKGMAIAINELSHQIQKNTELLRVTAATMAGTNGNDALKKLIEQMD